MQQNITILNILKIVLGAFAVILSFSITYTPAHAATDWDSMSASAFYARLFDTLQNKIPVYEYSETVVYTTFKSNKEQSSVAYTIEGVTQAGDPKNTYRNSSSSIYTFSQQGKKTSINHIELATINDSSFMKIPFSTKPFDGWVEVPESKYSGFGNYLGRSTEFALGRVASNTPLADATKYATDLAKWYSIFTYAEDDNVLSALFEDVPGATRYTLEIDPANLYDYYEALFESLTIEELGLMGLNSTEAIEALADQEYVDQIAYGSYTVIWIDNKTNLPVRYVSFRDYPSYVSPKLSTVAHTDVTLRIPKQPIVIKKPTEVTSFDKAAKALKIKDTEELDEDYAFIRQYKKELLKTRKKEDKAEINYNLGIEYEWLGRHADAAQFYTEASRNYKKGSVDAFESLAQAAVVLDNGAEAQRNFELALKKDPKDYYVLTNYSLFLLGLSTPSSQLQDLSKSKSLNATLLLKPDDTILLNQFLFLILSNKTAEAETLRNKFDDFETGENYMLAAKAYHRIGDSTRVKIYRELAKSSGYTERTHDKKFFALTFLSKK